MKLLIKIPTRSRPAQFLRVLNLYLDNITNPETFIQVTIDEDDFTMSDQVIDQFANNPKVYLITTSSKGKINAVNSELDHFAWDILLVASDDMYPQEKGFDQVIINAVKMYYPDTDGCLWFNDGHTDNRLNTIPILGKKYYQRFNYVYHPTYKSLWADNEYTEVAKSLSKIKYIPKVIIKHEHPDWGGCVPVDPLYITNNNYWGVDEKNYAERKARGFI